MIVKKQYQKPKALDLSGLSVVGYGSRGLCMGGHEPTTASCVDGDDVTQDPSACTPNGLGPELGNCNEGGDAANACINLGSIN